MKMEPIDRYYKILRVSPFSSFRKVESSYNSLMLRYHPSKPEGRIHKDYFIELVLAFDLIKKIKYSSDPVKTDDEIYLEWSNSDKAFALEKAEEYAKLKFIDFEKEFLPGCFVAIKGFVYLIYFAVALMMIIVPIGEFSLGRLSGRVLFYIMIGESIPFFYAIFRTIIDEEFITRRTWKRLRMKFDLLKLKRRIKLTPTRYKRLRPY
jgi:hypothetical protein